MQERRHACRRSFTKRMQELFSNPTFLQALDISAMLLGLLYIYQEYHASIWLWLTGVVMPVVDIFLYYSAGLYADFGMAIYYTLAAIYGFAVWKWGRKRGQQTTGMPITHVRRSLLLPSLVLFLLAWGALYVILVRFTNSTVPVLDSFGNALSFIGLWWLARKYAEQWLVWIVVDAELSALYFYKDIPFKGLLYALYVVIAVMGYRKWKKQIA